MNATLEFDSCTNCFLRCSKNFFSSIKNSPSSSSDIICVVLKQESSCTKIFSALKKDINIKDDNVVIINKIYGELLKLIEGTVVLKEIEKLVPITSLTLCCSNDDYSIANLHRDAIEEELINQTQIVKEGVPVIGFVNSSIKIPFGVSKVEPPYANMLNGYTKVTLCVSDSTEIKDNTRLPIEASTIIKLSSWDLSLLNTHVPELRGKCFCPKNNINPHLVLVHKLHEKNARKVLCSFKCCQKCLAEKSNSMVIAEQTLSHHFNLNQVIAAEFMKSNGEIDSLDLNLKDVPPFNAPIFESAGKDYSIIVNSNGHKWRVDLSTEGCKATIVKKRELQSKHRYLENKHSPHGLVYESIVDKILLSFPFPQKSLSLVSSQISCQGAGKSFLLKRLTCDQRLGNFFVLYSDATLLRGKRVDNVVKEITDLLDECCLCQPSILLIDNLDSALPAHSKNEEPSGDEIFGSRLARKLLNIFKTYTQNSVEIVFSSQSLAACHPLLMEDIDAVFLLPPLSVPQQLLFLNSLLGNDIGKAALEQCHDRLSLRSNLTVGEVVKLSKVLRSSPSLNLIESVSTIKISESCSLYEIQKLKPVTGEIKLADCGGLVDVKEEINKMLILPFKYPHLFSQIPFQLNRGLLLFGPPGVGKTLIVKGIAHEINMNFLTVKGPELLNKYIGASEEAVRNMFRRAEEMSPTLIFFDEFDSLAPCRGNDTTGVMDRVVNQLLTELDGVSQHESVFIIAATSRPDAIDPAILRPGRIGKKVLCPMPSPSDRTEIWGCLLKDVNHETNINTTVLAAETEFYSGADIKAIIYNAQLSLVKKAIATGSEKPSILTQELLLKTISQTNPSLSKSDLEDYESKYDNFLSGKTSVGWLTTQK
ncbi:hypothetical protein ACHWQZ_G008663 [Mnemiopsis leidyi]